MVGLHEWGATVHWGNHECQHVLWHTEAEQVPSFRDWAAGQYSNMITTTALLKKLRVKVMDWPSMSPDLNPIEHLWGILKQKMEECKVSNIHQLRDVVMEEWKRTPVVTCEALVNSMPKRLRQCWKIIVATQNIDTLGPIWKFSLRGVLTFVASGLDINGCVLSYFEGTANVHCYTSCTLTTLHCSKVSYSSVLSHEKNNKIFTKMWGVYSLLWDTVGLCQAFFRLLKNIFPLILYPVVQAPHICWSQQENKVWRVWEPDVQIFSFSRLNNRLKDELFSVLSGRVSLWSRFF